MTVIPGSESLISLIACPIRLVGDLHAALAGSRRALLANTFTALIPRLASAATSRRSWRKTTPS
jgi:hypothetical protein